MAGTTDALLEVAQQAGAGESRTVASLIARLRSRHVEVARSLLPGGRLRADVLLYITDLFAELEALAQGLRLLRELTPAHHRLPRLPRRAAERAAGRRRARGGRHPRPLRGRARPDPHRRRVRPGGARLRPHRPRGAAGARPAARQGRGAGGAGLHRRHARTARSPPWGAAAPISPPPCSPGASAPRGSRSGRTCPASSPPIPAWCPTRGSFPSSTPARPRSWRTTGPRCCTRARSSPSPAAAFRSSSARSPTRDSPGTEVSERVGAGRNPVKALTAAGGQALAHRHRQRHARRARHRRAHLRGAARPRGSPSR